MKLTTTNDVVSSALAMVAGAVIKKSTVPIMAGVKIAVEGDVAILETFNYSGERRRVAFTIDSNSVDGMCVVNHEQFSAIIAKLPGNVTLSLKGNDLIIRGGEHIKAGADVLTGSAQQVVGAIGVAAENKGYWFGTQSDQSSLAPDFVVANQVYDLTGVVKDMLALRQEGTLGGKAYALTLADGLNVVFNDQVTVADDVKAAAQAAIDGIKAGAIVPLP